MDNPKDDPANTGSIFNNENSGINTLDGTAPMGNGVQEVSTAPYSDTPPPLSSMDPVTAFENSGVKHSAENSIVDSLNASTFPDDEVSTPMVPNNGGLGRQTNPEPLPIMPVQPYSTAPGGSPVGTYISSTEPDRHSFRKAIVISGFVLLFLGLLATLFYFFYWTRSDIVYSRFQNYIVGITTYTAKSEVALIDDTAFTFEGNAESKEEPFGISGNAVSNKGNFESNVNITIGKATLDLSILSLNEKNLLNFYFKWKGIEQFYNSILQQESSQDIAAQVSLYVDVLKKYDEQWINFNLSSLLTEGTESATESITSKDYDSLVDKLMPIYNDRFIGIDKTNAVLSTSNIKGENVNGRDCWAYEISINQGKFNEMIDAMVSAIDSTTLSQNNKQLVKDYLGALKQQDSPAKVDTAYNSQPASSYTSTPKYTMWLDKLTGIPIKVSSANETKYQNKPVSTNTLTINVSELSRDKIVVGIDNDSRSYLNAFSYSSSTADSKEFVDSRLESDVTIDNKNIKNSYSFKFDPDISKNNDAFTGKVLQEKPKVSVPINKPEKSVPWTQLSEELFSTQFVR